MDILIKTIQFFLSLSILVVVHEAGHFLVARLFRIRVEKFYIFFNPWFSLFKFNYKQTEYGMGWLPLGGYVKIAGMVDESLDKDSISRPPQPDEFRAKSAWKRFLVLVAGVTMNVILAFFIYCGISYTYGNQYIDNDDVSLGYKFSEEAHELGFCDGDRIVRIGGEQIGNIHTILPTVVLADGDREVEVIRGGEQMQFTIPYACLNDMRRDGSKFEGFCTPIIPFVIDSVMSNTALSAGLIKGDRIKGINGMMEDDYSCYGSLFLQNANSTVSLIVERDGNNVELDVPVNEDGKIGVMVAPPFPVRIERYTLLQSIPAGARMTVQVMKNYWEQLRLIVRPDTGMYKQVGGFIAIAEIFPSHWDWGTFWNMTAFLSIVLAIMNIIPIPGLDGGHIVFTLWEMITRHRPSDRVLEVAQYIGMMLLFALLLYANGNDVLRHIIK